MQHKFERPIWLIVVANITKAFSHYLRNNWWYIQMVTIVTVTLIIRGIDRKIRAGKSCKNAIKYFVDRLSLKKLLTVGLHLWLHTTTDVYDCILPQTFTWKISHNFHCTFQQLFISTYPILSILHISVERRTQIKTENILRFSLPHKEVKSHNFFPSHDTLFPFSFQADVMKHV